MTATKEDFHVGELVEVSAHYTERLENISGRKFARLAMVMPDSRWTACRGAAAINVYVIYPDGKTTFIPPLQLKKIA